MLTDAIAPAVVAAPTPLQLRLVRQRAAYHEAGHAVTAHVLRRPVPSLELAAYAGSYEHPAYGTVQVALEGGSLVWRWNSFRADLAHYHYDTFVAKDRVTPEEYRRVAGELLVAMLEYGKSIGLTHISLCCDSFFLKTMHETRWDFRRLGPITRYPEGKCVSVLFDVSERMIANTREVREVHGVVWCYAAAPQLDNPDFKLAA